MFPTRRITTSGGDKFRDEKSLAFDGTNDYINCGDVTFLDGLNDFSYVAWVKFTDASANAIITKGSYNNSGATFGGYYSEGDASGRFRFSVANEGANGGFCYVSIFTGVST